MKVRLAWRAPRDGLDLLGGGRQIEHGRSETNAVFAGRALVTGWPEPPMQR